MIAGTIRQFIQRVFNSPRDYHLRRGEAAIHTLEVYLLYLVLGVATFFEPDWYPALPLILFNALIFGVVYRVWRRGHTHVFFVALAWGIAVCLFSVGTMFSAPTRVADPESVAVVWLAAVAIFARPWRVI